MLLPVEQTSDRVARLLGEEELSIGSGENWGILEAYLKRTVFEEAEEIFRLL